MARIEPPTLGSQVNGLYLCAKINFKTSFDFDSRPALIVIRDTNGHRFGAFVNEAFRISENSFGSGETFVFRIREGDDALQVEPFDSGKELILLFCSEILISGLYYKSFMAVINSAFS